MAMNDDRNRREAMDRGVRSRIAANVFLVSVMAIVVTIFVNYGAQQWSRSHDVRFDLTAQKRMQLQDITKNLARNIDDPIEIYLVYGVDQTLMQRARKDIHERNPDTGIVQNTYAPFVKDMAAWVELIVGELMELNTNIVFRSADAAAERVEPDTWRRRLNLGANQLLNNVVFYNLRTKTTKTIPLYSFFDCELGGPDPTLGFLQPKIRGFLVEQQLLFGIRSIIAQERKKAYIVGGHEEHQLTRATTLLQQDRFDLAYLEPEGDTFVIPDDADILLVFSPARSWPEAHQKALDEYLRSGGRVLMTQGMDCAEAFTDLLERAGLRMESRQIGHEAHHRTQLGKYWLYGSQLLRPQRGLPHPAMAPTVSDGLPIDLGFSRSYEFLKDYERTKITRDLLIRSTEGAEAVPWIFDGKDWRQAPERGTELGDFNLAAAVTYKRGPDAPPGKLVVIGSDSWLTTSSLLSRMDIANLDVFLNLVYWLTDVEQLIASIPRQFRGALIPLDGGRDLALQFLIIGVIPGLIVLGGLLTHLMRRR